MKKGSKRPREDADVGGMDSSTISTPSEDASNECKTPSRDPFASLKISPNEFLFSLPRQQCPSCGSRKKLYCCNCLLPLFPPSAAGKLPNVSLPISLHVLHERGEKLSKSTATHAKILSPSCVDFTDYPSVPDHLKPENTVLLFPSKDAKSVKEYDFSHVENVVVVDSTWQKAKVVLRDERIAALPCVKIESYETHFWRYQTLGKSCLATIEAIYYFYKEYITRTHAGAYDGRVDDLLFFFSYTYHLIQRNYKSNRGKTFKRIKGYIQYEENESDAEQSKSKDT